MASPETRPQLTVRPARDADALALREIFNEAIEDGLAVLVAVELAIVIEVAKALACYLDYRPIARGDLRIRRSRERTDEGSDANDGRNACDAGWDHEWVASYRPPLRAILPKKVALALGVRL